MLGDENFTMSVMVVFGLLLAIAIFLTALRMANKAERGNRWFRWRERFRKHD